MGSLILQREKVFTVSVSAVFIRIIHSFIHSIKEGKVFTVSISAVFLGQCRSAVVGGLLCLEEVTFVGSELSGLAVIVVETSVLTFLHTQHSTLQSTFIFEKVIISATYLYIFILLYQNF